MQGPVPLPLEDPSQEPHRPAHASLGGLPSSRGSVRGSFSTPSSTGVTDLPQEVAQKTT